MWLLLLLIYGSATISFFLALSEVTSEIEVTYWDFEKLFNPFALTPLSYTVNEGYRTFWEMIIDFPKFWVLYFVFILLIPFIIAIFLLLLLGEWVWDLFSKKN